jgi:hypothetical protein
MRYALQRGVFAGGICASLLLLSACGLSSGASSSARLTGGAQGSPSPSASAAASPAIQQGAVAVVLDKTRYASGDTVNATILNGLDHTIFAADHQTDCTVLVVEQQTGAGWQRVGRCLLASPTRLVPFAASSQTATPLANGPAGNGGASWGAGTYRVSLTYLNSDTDITAAGSTVYSATFTLG